VVVKKRNVSETVQEKQNVIKSGAFVRRCYK
jgi:hypothetical protein